MGEAVLLAEYSSVSYGVSVLDRMVKRSAVEVVYARPVCAGKYLIVVGGDVEDVGEAQAEAESLGSERRISSYLLTNAHRDILGYFRRSSAQEASERETIEVSPALGLFETTNAATGFHSLDAALKNGSVGLGKVWLGHFLAGKFCYVLAGQVGDVGAAIAAARNATPDKNHVDNRVIPSPDKATLRLLLDGKMHD